MIGYITLGTNQPDRSRPFYDSLLAEVGGKRVMEMGDFVLWAGAAPSGMIATAPASSNRFAPIGSSTQ